MIYTSLRRTEQFAFLLGDGDAETAFPWVFLKDNDPSGFHETAGERTFDLLQIDLDIRPETAELTDDGLLIKWADMPTHSLFSHGWLSEHMPGHDHPDTAEFPPVLWDHESMSSIAVHDSAACAASDRAMLDMLHQLKATGIVLIDGLTGRDAGMAFGRMIGAIRTTNFGDHFSVHARPAANNLAYTDRSLPLHTDLPNQVYPPDFQFLHCVSNSASGGDSQLVDGWKVIDDLRQQEPEYFTLLSSVQIPFRFCDQDADILSRRPCIELDRQGRIVQLSFSGHLAAPFDMPADQMIPYYRAFRDLMRRIRLDRYRIDLKLKTGQMMVMNNRRVLHGRSAFSTGSGERELMGFYIDKADLDSKYRVLLKAESPLSH